uniref:Uncharacterized protein n=1 Tax=Pyxicephalus adspersus TaxID=30357 RepID=A0AAV3A1R0_PYXAD|nr:TPA: hypothetical protein GDO54_017262 [Pyxicephalus adspersus]
MNAPQHFVGIAIMHFSLTLYKVKMAKRQIWKKKRHYTCFFNKLPQLLQVCDQSLKLNTCFPRCPLWFLPPASMSCIDLQACGRNHCSSRGARRYSQHQKCSIPAATREHHCDVVFMCCQKYKFSFAFYSGLFAVFTVHLCGQGILICNKLKFSDP